MDGKLPSEKCGIPVLILFKTWAKDAFISTYFDLLLSYFVFARPELLSREIQNEKVRCRIGCLSLLNGLN